MVPILEHATLLCSLHSLISEFYCLICLISRLQPSHQVKA